MNFEAALRLVAEQEHVQWGNISLIAGIISALAVAAVALYRARPQRDIDQITAQKIELEIKKESAAYDRRRTIRLLRLEKYVDLDIQYHRAEANYKAALHDLLEEAQRAGFLTDCKPLPVPPTPPDLPPIEIHADDP